MKLLVVLTALCFGLAFSEELKNDAAVSPLSVGATPAEWTVADWFNSPALTLAELRGKVVLVRFWTSPECPFCSATAPALNEFNAAYKEKGLQVIGFYTHKKPAPIEAGEAKKYADLYGFTFPNAVDPGSKTLKHWWLAGDRKKFTSVSFLLDRKGVVQFIHPGGQYVKGDADYAALKAKIESLLEQK